MVVAGAGMAASNLDGPGMKRVLLTRKGLLLILEGPLLTLGRPLLSLEELFADFGDEVERLTSFTITDRIS